MYKSVSPSGSVAVADNATVAAVAVHDGSGSCGAGQLAGNVTVEEAAVKETVGGWFGKTVGRRAFRWPAKTWNPNPLPVTRYLNDSTGSVAWASPGADATDATDTTASRERTRRERTRAPDTADFAGAAIETELRDAWRDSVVLVITEFGRTARINGTDGTDHGTATVAFLAGGALKGGRVIADWPGLNTLHDGRDLKPTTDLRAVLKGVLKDHLRVDEAALAMKVFPDSGRVKPMRDLLAHA